MRRYVFLLSSIVFSLLSFAWTSGQGMELPGQPTIYSDNQQDYVDASTINNPIRDGAFAGIKNPGSDPAIRPDQKTIGGIQGVDTQIQDYGTAQSQTLQIIKNLINYALGLASLVALIYLIFHGIKIITAMGDEKKYKEGLEGLKFAAIALLGIGLSWIFISTIFWFINSVLLK